MHYVLADWYRLWSWLLANGASRATAILVFVTAAYAMLTWRMARAIGRQTRAMVQPVALLEFHWREEPYYPASSFEITNRGSQPLLLLDVKLECHFRGRYFAEHYVLWDEHIIPPGESLRPQFDFKPELARAMVWNSIELSYSLQVVASDLSKQVVLTYRNIPVLHIVNVRKGMPISVRWRYFVKPFARRYHGVLYRFKRPKIAK